MGGRADGRMSERVDGRMGGWADGRTGGRGRTSGQTDRGGRADRLADGQTGGRADRGGWADDRFPKGKTPNLTCQLTWRQKSNVAVLG